MTPRSHALGYNHNVRHAERVWHVQTEDSGVRNPHIFTHLFHQGTILASKRVDYDPELPIEAVQKLMQTQHKAMLRSLKDGAFDEKIAQFLSALISTGAPQIAAMPGAVPPVDEFEDAPLTTPFGKNSPAPGTPTAAPAPPKPAPAAPASIRPGAAPIRPGAAPIRPGAAAIRPGAAPIRPGAAPIRPAAAPIRPGAAPIRPAAPAKTAAPASPSLPVKTATVAPRSPATSGPPSTAKLPLPKPAPSRPSPPSSAAKPASAVLVPSANRITVPAAPKSAPPDGAVVTRPAVIVGTQKKPPPQPKRDVFNSESSDKSLDDVILAYLSEDPKDK